MTVQIIIFFLLLNGSKYFHPIIKPFSITAPGQYAKKVRVLNHPVYYRTFQNDK